MKTNHWLIIIGLGGVFVAVWAALRNKSTPIIVQSSPSLQPLSLGPGQGVTPLGAPPVQQLTPDNIPSPVSVQNVQPSTAASGVPQYTSQTQLTAGETPIAAPTPALSRPSFYAGPILDFIRSMSPNTESFSMKKDCGCGGACKTNSHNCSDCSSKCDISSSRFPDGRGGCMAFNRKKQIAQAVRDNPMGFVLSSENLLSAGVDMFGVYQQTQFDMKAANNFDGSTPPASPFLTAI
jgi:hypothetical protein